MRDPLAEPRTTPALRWSEPTDPAVTYGGCPPDQSAVFDRRWPNAKRPTPSPGDAEEHVMTVHAFGLDAAAVDALFTRVADAAHALDELVTCYGGPAFDTPPTLRDLLRAARAAGAPLRRQRHGSPTFMRAWQVWDEAEHRRWIEVMQWPDHAGLGVDGETRWRIRISGYDTSNGYVHVELRDPSIELLTRSLRTAGWDLGSTT